MPKSKKRSLEAGSNEDVASKERSALTNGEDLQHVEVKDKEGSRKKRKSTDKSRTDSKEEEELEIDNDAPTPLSKKDQRRQKKGKPITAKAEELQNAADIVDNGEKREKEDETSGDNKDKEKEKSKEKSKETYGVWIGNLSYHTTPEILSNFIIDKLSITKSQITRIKLPMKDKEKSEGFAYVDFSSKEIRDECIQLSEEGLNGRRLLIKNAKSFEGRPVQEKVIIQSKSIFVGNLPFDTTDLTLKAHFERFYPEKPISKVRLMTFEDSGKCKGFGFVDYPSIPDANEVFDGKRKLERFNGAKLRIQMGEERKNKRRAEKLKKYKATYNNGEQRDLAVPAQ